MEKIDIIDAIYNFKNKELSADDINYKIMIFKAWEESEVELYYTLKKFIIGVRIGGRKIVIEKDAKDKIFKEQNGKYKMNISKLEAKNLAGLIFTAHNTLKSE